MGDFKPGTRVILTEPVHTFDEGDTGEIVSAHVPYTNGRDYIVRMDDRDHDPTPQDRGIYASHDQIQPIEKTHA